MLNINDLSALYLLAQHGAAALFQRTEAALAAAQTAPSEPPAPVDSTPPTA